MTGWVMKEECAAARVMGLRPQWERTSTIGKDTKEVSEAEKAMDQEGE